MEIKKEVVIKVLEVGINVEVNNIIDNSRSEVNTKRLADRGENILREGGRTTGRMDR